MKIKNFSKSLVRREVPNLIFMQNAGGEQFWERELRALFNEVSPIKDYTQKEYELFFLDYSLGKPNYESGFDAKENNDSYVAPLRVKVQLNNLKTKQTTTQEVFFGNFPVLTSNGTFILNGVERVVISQLIRSPGVFFPLSLVNGEKFFGAKIIPNRGVWLEFEIESSGVMSVKIDRKRKVPATMLLKALGGYNDDDIRNLFLGADNGEQKFIDNTLAKDITKSQGDALIEIYRRLRSEEMINADSAKEFIFNMFFNFDRYDFSSVGRWKVWSRLKDLKPKKEREITKEDRILNIEDVISVMKEVIRLQNDPHALPDQIDHLGNRRVRNMAELLANKLRIGMARTARIAKDRMSTIDSPDITPSQVVNPRPFVAQVTQFFTASQFSQFMDNINPLSELEHKRRLTATGPGGLTRGRAGFDVRDVQPSHYGRICPIQTPEGPNVGLVTHLAMHAELDAYGFIETPYYKVVDGKVTNEIVHMNANEEERYNIAPANIPMDDKGNILNARVQARIKGEPGEIEKEKIDFMDVAPEQFISCATSLIPFLQNDDANRAQMGSNMQRQAVPLLNPEAPLVGTGMEKYVARDSSQVILAEEAGEVTYADSREVKVKGTKGIKTYTLRTFDKSNQYTCMHQVCTVNKGDKVKKGDILSEGGAIDKGRLSLGRNLLVAFLSWRGNTFEDAIVLSENIVKKDVFTNIHIEEFFCDVRETKLGPEVTTYDIPNVGEDKLKDLDEEGIVRVGAEVGPNDILVGKISPKGETDLSGEERLLRAVFGDKAKDVKDTSLRMEHGKRGRIIDVRVFSRAEGFQLEPGVIKRIRIRSAQVRKIRVGDKLAGRHGNKGIVVKILPPEEMPFLEDGTPVDIILNPLSVASRMNLGQILETHLGLAVHKLGYLAETPSFSGAKEEDIREELKKAGYPEDGKLDVWDPTTGEKFPAKITVGYVYMIKLIHMVEDKIHMRSVGPYSLITQQPLGGKAQFGGQRLGEMEVWAMEGYGAAYALQEMLTIKSDDVQGRFSTYEAIIKGDKIKSPNVPAAFNLLTAELKSLALNLVINEKKEK
ncbi:MAG: DNA-directed RNA polymerase subunit beta [Candidatus Pacebacteria bacterium]|nr:DNA-directed RNA polymerase subunit beta [Candidatus Paceibacterota bacterium]